MHLGTAERWRRPPLAASAATCLPAPGRSTTQACKAFVPAGSRGRRPECSASSRTRDRNLTKMATPLALPKLRRRPPRNLVQKGYEMRLSLPERGDSKQNKADSDTSGAAQDLCPPSQARARLACEPRRILTL